MTSPVKDRIARLRPVGRCGLLAVVLVAALAVALPIAWWQADLIGVEASLIAAAVIWLASAVGLVLGELFCGPGDAMANLLFPMLMRMFLPLAACVLVAISGGPLRSAGFVFWVLGFYLVALPVDTMFSVLKVEHPAG